MMSYKDNIPDPTMKKFFWLVGVDSPSVLICIKGQTDSGLSRDCNCCIFIIVEFMTDRAIYSLMDMYCPNPIQINSAR